jgi:ribosomal protein S18 acetylase RimI-like enzyme
MIRASHQDKALVVDILAKAFDTNLSVNYLIRPDQRRKERIRKLMAYSFEVCHLFGKVLLSEDKKACALLLFPDQKKTTWRSVLLDLELALFGLGLPMVRRTLNREARIKRFHPQQPICYLWFLGVDPAYQRQGLGKQLLREILDDSDHSQRPLYLETSTIRNVPWYQQMGLEVYHELDFGYTLYFMRYNYNNA